MPPALVGSADANNKYEDLSGIDTSSATNPYDALIQACDGDPTQISALYSRHRTQRNAQQKESMLSAKFTKLNTDELLRKLEDPTIDPGFVDPRNCLVFWARPPEHVRALVGEIQTKLKNISPNLWLMPSERQHLTALEITHSLTRPEIQTLVDTMGPIIPRMVNFMMDEKHRARLIKPLVSYDSSAIALSFLPAAGEAVGKLGRTAEDDRYTYHHLRRDLFNLATTPSTPSSNGTGYPGVNIESRYVVPSAHITIGRFLIQDDHRGPEAMQNWVREIEHVNQWLMSKYWPVEFGGNDGSFEWVVGQAKGLDCRMGTLWYGGGETVLLGEGF